MSPRYPNEYESRREQFNAPGGPSDPRPPPKTCSKCGETYYTLHKNCSAPPDGVSSADEADLLAQIAEKAYSPDASVDDLKWSVRVVGYLAARRRKDLDAGHLELAQREAALDERERDLQSDREALTAAEEASVRSLADLELKVQAAKAELATLRATHVEERKQHKAQIARDKAALRRQRDENRTMMMQAISELEAAKPSRGFLGIQIGETDVAKKIDRVIRRFRDALD